MSSQTIKERLPVSGTVGSIAVPSWLRFNWKKLLYKKYLLVGAGLLAALSFAGYYFWSSQSSAPQYMTARVERGSLRNTVTATGTLQAVTTVQVGSQASGTISALMADFNSRVRKGQVIAQLDPSTTQAQVQQARANLEILEHKQTANSYKVAKFYDKQKYYRAAVIYYNEFWAAHKSDAASVLKTGGKLRLKGQGLASPLRSPRQKSYW